jgi:hypothetical protein
MYIYYLIENDKRIIALMLSERKAWMLDEQESHSKAKAQIVSLMKETTTTAYA